MIVSIIAAVSRNGVIGAGGKLPWHLPADFKRFKELTMGHPILMGRKTFESIGKPLPGRTNIVITRQKDFACCGALTTGSLEEALRICEKEAEVFVIGGAEIYKEALPLADRIYLTRIEQGFEGDTFLPEINPAVWKETSRQDFPDGPLPHSFLTLARR